MTIKPTREEWQEAHTRANAASGTTRSIVEAALGCPCPPEPAPEPFRVRGYTLVRAADPYPGGRGKIAVPRHVLSSDEADAMAKSLVEHAAYAREQEEGKTA